MTARRWRIVLALAISIAVGLSKWFSVTSLLGNFEPTVVGGFLFMAFGWLSWDCLLPLIKKLYDYIKADVGCFSVFRLRHAWYSLLKQNDDEPQQLLASFLNRYVQEEINDILGESSPKKHFIVTNFVAYSGLVDEIVKKACRICPSDHQVVCFTTLTMPITKWFNFLQNQAAPLKYWGIRDEWEKYTKSLKNSVNNSTQSFVLQRCVLTVPDDLAKEHAPDPDFGFWGESEMKRHCKNWILVPHSQDGSLDLAKFEPVTISQVNEWISGPLSKLKTFLGAYGASDRAYIILPPELSLVDPLPAPAGYKWCPLVSVFIQLFHSHIQTQNALCHTFERHEWNQLFHDSQFPQKMPEDLFLVGLRKEGSTGTNWLFCLAADVDQKLEKISLEFVTEKLNSERFQALIRYTDLLVRSPKLTTWG